MPAVWRKGYATEAAKATLDYAFTTLQLEKINACAHVENVASLSILQKIGMQYTGDCIIDDCPVKCFEAMYSSWVRSWFIDHTSCNP